MSIPPMNIPLKSIAAMSIAVMMKFRIRNPSRFQAAGTGSVGAFHARTRPMVSMVLRCGCHAARRSRNLNGAEIEETIFRATR